MSLKLACVTITLLVITAVYLNEIDETTVHTPELNFTGWNQSENGTAFEDPTMNATNDQNATEESELNETTVQILTEEPAPTMTTGSGTKSWKDFFSNEFMGNYSDLPCTCDLIVDECDVNCCCDEQCTPEDQKAFSDCHMPHIVPDERYCFKEQFLFLNNTAYRVAKTSSNLFCIYTDNYKKRFHYADIAVITNPNEFDQLSKRFSHFTWIPPPLKSAVPSHYKAGVPIFIVSNYGVVGHLDILRNLATGECVTNNPAPYMVDSDFRCHQIFTDMLTDCTKNVWLSGRTYYEGFRVLKTLQLLEANTSNFTDSDLVEVVPQLCGDYHVSSEVSCNSMTSDREEVPSPSYDDVTGTCSNVVSRIKYVITHNGTDGVHLVLVQLTLGEIPAASKSLVQSHGVVYQWASTTQNKSIGPDSPRRWSGNPGYQLGAPLLAGKIVTHDIGQQEGEVTHSDVRMAVQLNQEPEYWLTILGLSAFGTCLSDDGSAAQSNRISVKFGQNLKTGCRLVVSLSNLTEMCGTLQRIALESLTGSNPPDVVGAYGNSNPVTLGEWVPILWDRTPSSSRAIGSSTCSNIVRDLHFEILHARFGSLANPQSKIIGIRATFGHPTDIKLRCTGVYCNERSSHFLTQSFSVTTSVIFVDVSKKAVPIYAERPTIHIQLPHDFFYPFASGTASVFYINLCSFSLLLVVAFSVRVV